MCNLHSLLQYLTNLHAVHALRSPVLSSPFPQLAHVVILSSVAITNILVNDANCNYYSLLLVSEDISPLFSSSSDYHKSQEQETILSVSRRTNNRLVHPGPCLLCTMGKLSGEGTANRQQHQILPF